MWLSYRALLLRDGERGASGPWRIDARFDRRARLVPHLDGVFEVDTVLELRDIANAGPGGGGGDRPTSSPTAGCGVEDF